MARRLSPPSPLPTTTSSCWTWWPWRGGGAWRWRMRQTPSSTSARWPPGLGCPSLQFTPAAVSVVTQPRHARARDGRTLCWNRASRDERPLAVARARHICRSVPQTWACRVSRLQGVVDPICTACAPAACACTRAHNGRLTMPPPLVHVRTCRHVPWQLPQLRLYRLPQLPQLRLWLYRHVRSHGRLRACIHARHAARGRRGGPGRFGPPPADGCRSRLH